MSDLVHIAGSDGLVHSLDALSAQPPGFVLASPPGHVDIPPAGHVDVPPGGHVIISTPPGDSVLHVIPENIVGHFINHLV